MVTFILKQYGAASESSSSREDIALLGSLVVRTLEFENWTFDLSLKF